MNEDRYKEMERAIAALRAAWYQVPQLRLGQVISLTLPDTYGMDPYYIPDTELTQCLERAVRHAEMG